MAMGKTTDRRPASSQPERRTPTAAETITADLVGAELRARALAEADADALTHYDPRFDQPKRWWHVDPVTLLELDLVAEIG